jgi:hypothetical protein
MHHYAAYGLGIGSTLPLPELVPSSPPGGGSDDITIGLGPVAPRPASLDEAGFGFWAAAGEACHYLDRVGAFLVRGGREIVVDPAPGVEARVLRLSLLGPALALALHQRGLLVLHASVVAHGDGAVAILGRNGWGKSTIAAALCRHGFDLVTDDVAAVRITPDGAHVLPGFPQVKLWPEAAALLCERPDALPVLHPTIDKRAWRPVERFSLVPQPLERIYALAPGTEAGIEPLDPRAACFELLSHWYGHRFGGGLLQGGAAARHLRQCVTLADRVPMRRLHRRGGSPALLGLADLVAAELRTGPYAR